MSSEVVMREGRLDAAFYLDRMPHHCPDCDRAFASESERDEHVQSDECAQRGRHDREGTFLCDPDVLT